MAEREEKSPEAQQRRRRIYLRVRIPIARQELERVQKESRALAEKRKSKGEEGAKELQERLVYLGEHRTTLRKELEALMEEQKALRKQRSEGKPARSPAQD